MAASKGRYLYGLIRAGAAGPLGCLGLEDEGEARPVYALQVDSVAAVLSEYSARQRVLPVRKNLDPHNTVIREIMKTTTIIPMTFGHVAKSEQEVMRALRRNLEDIRTELDRLDGKVEMGLKVLWDVDNIFEYFVGLDPELAAFRDEIFGRSRAPTVAEKMELGRLFEEQLTTQREQQAQRVVETLGACSAELRVNPPKDEKTVMHLAFLIEREKLKMFEEKVYEVAATFPTHYVFDYNGPWAPFHFVELDLRTAA